MRAVIQRVKFSSVTVENEMIGKIGKGLLVLLGIAKVDKTDDTKYLADKIVNLRIFEDENRKMNRSLMDTGGEMLVVSQFTLLGDCKKGRRPSFVNAAAPDHAIGLYRIFWAAGAQKIIVIKNLRHAFVIKIQTILYSRHMPVLTSFLFIEFRDNPTSLC
ncbi:MAG: D-tyrosyl-tRNA(Tyr) deacylase [Deltaproteobacteria bacterium]|nr:D-tyrosyl-tRNA(Tyr) deacylase [Deltaproteobacteria bacterium]